jgi:hypothetical protein
LYPNPLPLNTPFEGATPVLGAWTNYYFDVQEEILKLDLIVNITSDTLCDFYVNYLHAPDFTHWLVFAKFISLLIVLFSLSTPNRFLLLILLFACKLVPTKFAYSF